MWEGQLRAARLILLSYSQDLLPALTRMAHLIRACLFVPILHHLVAGYMGCVVIMRLVVLCDSYKFWGGVGNGRFSPTIQLITPASLFDRPQNVAQLNQLFLHLITQYNDGISW
jgi:hypothetical protein